MEFEEKVIGKNSYFNMWNLDNYNKTVINTKLGKIYIYCLRGWNAKKFEEGKELYNMEIIQSEQEINSFCYWLNSIIH